MPLIAYDRSGNVLATLDHLVAEDESGTFLVDLAGMEADGEKLRSAWEVSGAAGSCHWPEHLGQAAGEFRVVLDRRFKHPARRLVHRRSGHERVREEIEREVERRVGRSPKDEQGRRVVDVREVTGSPTKPLRLDAEGRTVDPLSARAVGSGIKRRAGDGRRAG